MRAGRSRLVLLIRGSGFVGVEVVDTAVGAVFGALEWLSSLVRSVKEI